jgi:hypothetical protein
VPHFRFIVQFHDREYAEVESPAFASDRDAYGYALEIIHELKSWDECSDLDLTMIVQDAAGQEVFVLPFHYTIN